MEPARTHISERSHKSTAKLPFSGNCPLFRVAGTPFFFRQCERKAIAAETGAWAGARLQEQSPQSCRKRGAAQVVCVQRTRPNQWLVCWYKREKGWIVQQLPRRRLEVHIQIHWNESGKHVSRLAGDCAESGVIKQAETCAQCCRSCSRGIRNRARAYRLKESRGSPQRRKVCPAKQAVIGSEWAEWIQHAHVRHLAVTEHNERPKIAIRKTVQLGPANIDARPQTMARPQPRRDFAKLVRVVDAALRKVKDVDTHGTVRQNHQLADGAGRTEWTKTPVGRIDRLCYEAGNPV